MTRGEVWWADVPGVGRRPVLVLTRDTAISLMRKVVIAEITTQIRGIPTEVSLDESDGLPRLSAVSVDTLHTVSKRRLLSRITALSGARLEEVCEALRYSVAC